MVFLGLLGGKNKSHGWRKEAGGCGVPEGQQKAWREEILPILEGCLGSGVSLRSQMPSLNLALEMSFTAREEHPAGTQTPPGIPHKCLAQEGWFWCLTLGGQGRALISAWHIAWCHPAMCACPHVGHPEWDTQSQAPCSFPIPSEPSWPLSGERSACD